MHKPFVNGEILPSFFGWRETISRVETADRKHQRARIKTSTNLVEILVLERLYQLEQIQLQILFIWVDITFKHGRGIRDLTPRMTDWSFDTSSGACDSRETAYFRTVEYVKFGPSNSRASSGSIGAQRFIRSTAWRASDIEVHLTHFKNLVNAFK